MDEPALDVLVGPEPEPQCGAVDGEAGGEGGELRAGADEEREGVVVG